MTDRLTCGFNFQCFVLWCIQSFDSFTLRPSDEIAPDGFHFVMTMKNYEPKQLLADEKLMVKCMSEMMGHEINIKKAVFLSEFR